jgi:hypothetical protein
MNNSMRDPDTTLAAWLDEGPVELPDSIRRSIATSVRTTTQRRRGFGPLWRFPMNGFARFALAAATVVVVAAGGLYLLGPGQQESVGGPAGSPTPSPSASPATPLAGTVTLTDTGCTWEGNPGSLAMPSMLTIELRNDTDDYANFDLHWIKAGHTYAEGVAYVADIAPRLATGEDWPPNDFSVNVHSHGVTANADSTIGWAATGSGPGPAPQIPGERLEPGSYGIVCSANTSPTGDILTVFLVGPLELTGAAPSVESSATTSP